MPVEGVRSSRDSYEVIDAIAARAPRDRRAGSRNAQS
jgi:hypothetical protein